MARRIEPTAAIPTGQDRVYLAPGRGSPHAPVNAAEIAAAAAARGFAVVNPEELGFAEQVRLVRHAQFIVMSEARQVLLSLFAQREAKLLHLCDPYTAELPLRSGLLDETGVDVRVMTGSYLQLDDKHPEKSNYRIDAGGFCESIDAWLGDQDRAERLLPRPGMPNVFTYWDKPNLTPIRPTLDVAVTFRQFLRAQRPGYRASFGGAVSSAPRNVSAHTHADRQKRRRLAAHALQIRRAAYRLPLRCPRRPPDTRIASLSRSLGSHSL
jgi:hypothetical protein